MAVNITMGLKFISSDCLRFVSHSVVFCLEQLRSDLYCGRKVTGSLAYYPQNSGSRHLKTNVHISGHLSDLNILVLLSYLFNVENTASLHSDVVEVDVRTIKPSLIFQELFIKVTWKKTQTKQEMIWHGRQEAQLYTQQQDLAEVLPSGLFSCSSKKV